MITPNELMKSTKKFLGENFAYYLKCKFCQDTSNEDELQYTGGRCPTCNNKHFDEVKEDDER